MFAWCWCEKNLNQDNVWPFWWPAPEAISLKDSWELNGKTGADTSGYDMGYRTQNKVDWSLNWYAKAWQEEWQRALRAGAGSAGRDNDPGGLGYMPDSQGPNMAKSQYRDRCFGSPVIHHQASLPQGTHLGREIINGHLFINYSSSSSYPPTYVGIYMAIYKYL